MSPEQSRNTSSFKRTLSFLIAAGISGFLLIGLVWIFLTYSSVTPGRNLRFMGRFHPAFVHLPIGILLGVFLYETGTILYPDLRKKSVSLFLIWIGFLSAVASSLAGFFLSLTGGYEATYLFWHKWFGVFVAVSSGVCFVFAGLEYLNATYQSLATRYRRMYRTSLVFMVVLISITGHLGGTLTHGPGYATKYLPKFVRASLDLDSTSATGSKQRFQDVQEAKIYEDLVRPILDRRCVSCHGPYKQKADLRLDTKAGIRKGGENGKIINPGNPNDSELVRRITLPPYHEKVMPPDSEAPLSIGNTELIRWWIASGASFDAAVSDVNSDSVPSSVHTVLNRLSGPPEPDPLEIYETDVPSPDPSLIKRINGSTAWNVTYLSDETRFLNVRVKPDQSSEISRTDMNKLKPVRNQVAWLDVRDQTLTDKAWAFLEKFSLLNRLHAQNTNIRNKHLKHLSSLPYLGFLNLNRTDVSDRGLRHLNYDSLTRLILWKTDVSDQIIDELKSSYPQLEIERGTTELDQTYQSLSYQASVTASNVFKGQTSKYGPKKAVDGNANTRWATDGEARDPWIKINLDDPETIVEVEIDEAIGTRVQSHTLEYREDDRWKTIYEGETIGPDFERSFDPVETQVVRLNIHKSSNGPTIYEIRLYGPEE